MSKRVFTPRPPRPLPDPIHWAPDAFDDNGRVIGACGRDVTDTESWTVSRLPYGEPPTCAECAAAAART